LRVPAGTFFGLLGPDGAGRSVPTDGGSEPCVASELLDSFPGCLRRRIGARREGGDSASNATGSNEHSGSSVTEAATPR